jgi:hypothetical protein
MCDGLSLRDATASLELKRLLAAKMNCPRSLIVHIFRHKQTETARLAVRNAERVHVSVSKSVSRNNSKHATVQQLSSRRARRRHQDHKQRLI